MNWMASRKSARARCALTVLLLSAGGVGCAPERGADANAVRPAPGQAETQAATTPSAHQVVQSAAAADAGLVPPGIAVRPGEALAPGEVALEYETDQSPERLLAWYRGEARRGRFSLGSELEEGAERVLTGTTGRRGAFTIRLAPDERGGTAAMVLVTGR